MLRTVIVAHHLVTVVSEKRRHQAPCGPRVSSILEGRWFCPTGIPAESTDVVDVSTACPRICPPTPTRGRILLTNDVAALKDHRACFVVTRGHEPSRNSLTNPTAQPRCGTSRPRRCPARRP